MRKWADCYLVTGFEVQRQLHSLITELELQGSEPCYLHFRMLLEDQRWPAVSALQKRNGGSIYVHAKFFQEDFDRAPYMQLIGYLQGYPQPERFGKYRKLTYDFSEGCERCSVGKRQSSPFRLKKEPHWQKRSIHMLTWIYDEIFIRPEAWEAVFAPLGVGFRPVVEHRSGKELTTVVQLDVQQLVELELGDHPYEDCVDCKRRRYVLPYFDFLPPPVQSDVPVFRSAQWFGTGFDGRRPIYISQDVYRKLTELGITGGSFYPCAPKET